jgi:hypothetical protein
MLVHHSNKAPQGTPQLHLSFTLAAPQLHTSYLLSGGVVRQELQLSGVGLLIRIIDAYEWPQSAPRNNQDMEYSIYIYIYVYIMECSKPGQ